MELLQLTAGQLRKAAVLKERIDDLNRELEAILGSGTTGTAPSGGKLHWTQTPAGKARLSRSLRKSWRRRGAKGNAEAPTSNGARVHWTQTPAGKAKMAKLMRKTWKRRKLTAA